LVTRRARPKGGSGEMVVRNGHIWTVRDGMILSMTMATYRSLFKTHVVPHIGDHLLARVGAEDVEQMMVAMQRKGKGAKLRQNTLTLTGQIFRFGRRKGWCRANPCDDVDRPQVEESLEIRFLQIDEVEALLRAVPLHDPLGPTEQVLYLTAALVGLRQGELFALRWRDVDWAAGRIRVRQNYVRGHWQTPKTRRGFRSPPMVDRVAGELERHFQQSAYQHDDDLVFCHPHSGRVLDNSYIDRRYKKALKKAGVREVRFHDLRHTFGTRMAAGGVPERTLQEWMGIRDSKTMQIYADYAPSEHEGEMAERALRGPLVLRGPIRGPKVSESEVNSDDLSVPERA
jgi:integrase